uniref:MRG-binding protein n=1 Tax=Anopheles dirus TaxID=7168 RepID=A0A182MYR7_9DIPT
MALREKNEIESFEWTPEEEMQLFLAMEGVRPVGVNRHFFMACIVERMSKTLQRDISSETIWSHLRTIYNLKALNEQEPVPFLNEECDFSLPESDFSSAIAKRRLEGAERTGGTPTCEQEPKKQEPKTETTAIKTSATKISSTSRPDPKEPEKDDKDTKERESGSIKIKAKSHESSGGHDSGPKRSQKRTRGSMSNEPGHSNTSSPANTPPNGPSTKRRRI